MSPSCLWIVLVNYKGVEDTLECLASIRRDSVDVHVIVVDNGSKDGSSERIRAAHPWAELVENVENLGFTGGNNCGIRLALGHGAEWVWLLNNDTIVYPGTIATLCHVADGGREWGILTPRIDYFDRPGEAWFAGSEIDLSRGKAVHVNDEVGHSNTPRELPWVTGCAMFCRREVLEQTRGFDDRFFLNWEDVDLSLRVLDLGWKIGIVPTAVIAHKVSRSRKSKLGNDIYYSTRNRLLVVWTHAATRRTLSTVYTGLISLRESVRWVVNREPHGADGIRATLHAIVDFSISRFGKLKT